MADLLTIDALSVLVTSFCVGIVVGLTGMGGGALMTPALIFLGVNPAAAVANDLVAAGVNKSVGAAVHWKSGSPNLRLATLLMIGSVPCAFAGGFIVQSVGDEDARTEFLTTAIGIALLFAAASYALRMYLQLRLVAKGNKAPRDQPPIRTVPTILVGAVGGRAGRDHLGRLRVADHGGAAADLPDDVGSQARRHRPRAGGPPRPGRGHRARRHRGRHLGRADPADPRRYAGHLRGREDGALGQPVGDPPRHRDRADPDRASRCWESGPRWSA